MSAAPNALPNDLAQFMGMSPGTPTPPDVTQTSPIQGMMGAAPEPPKTVDELMHRQDDIKEMAKTMKELTKGNPSFQETLASLGPSITQNLNITPTPHAPTDAMDAASKDVQWVQNKQKLGELQQRLSQSPQQIEEQARQQINQSLGLPPDTPNTIKAAADNIIDSRYSGKIGHATRFLTDLFKSPGSQFTTDIAYEQARKAYDESRKQVHDVIQQERANDTNNIKDLHETSLQQLAQFGEQAKVAQLQEKQRKSDIDTILATAKLGVSVGQLAKEQNRVQLQATVDAWDRIAGNKPDIEAFKAVTADLMAHHGMSEGPAKQEALRMMNSAVAARQAILQLGGTNTDTTHTDATGKLIESHTNQKTFGFDPTGAQSEARNFVHGAMGQFVLGGGQTAPQNIPGFLGGPATPAATPQTAPAPRVIVAPPSTDPSYVRPLQGSTAKDQFKSVQTAKIAEGPTRDLVATALAAEDPKSFLGAMHGNDLAAMYRKIFSGQSAAEIQIDASLPPAVIGAARASIGNSNRLNQPELKAFSTAMPQKIETYGNFVKAAALQALAAQIRTARDANPSFQADMPKILAEADRLAKAADNSTVASDKGVKFRKTLRLRDLSELQGPQKGKTPAGASPQYERYIYQGDKVLGANPGMPWTPVQ